jgi:hypothetical protein
VLHGLGLRGEYILVETCELLDGEKVVVGKRDLATTLDCILGAWDTEVVTALLLEPLETALRDVDIVVVDILDEEVRAFL